MRNLKTGLLLSLCVVLLTPMLSACSQSAQVENQAFVLVMGLDRTDDGQIEICVQLPRISGGGSSTDNKGGGNSQDNYIRLSVTGENFQTALERLRWAVPRNLDLAQMKLIIISKALASEDDFRELIRQIAQTERLFTAARVTVCEGNTRDFVEAIQPTIGTRLSTDINSMFEHYIDVGYIPSARLAELYYQTESFYSDPMVSYAMLHSDSNQEQSTADNSKPAVALSGTPQNVSEDCDSSIPNRYLGAAVFSEGKLCGILDGQQTLYTNLLRNELNTFHYVLDGQSVAIAPATSIILGVDTSSSPVRLTVWGHLAVAAHDRITDEEALIASLESDIRDTIQAAQQMGADPFGFAERAARKFLTLNDWIAFNWREKFSQAEVIINISFAKTGA